MGALRMGASATEAMPKATTETIDALRMEASATKAMQKTTNIDDVDKTRDEINEQTENMKEIQEELPTSPEQQSILMKMNWKYSLRSWRGLSWNLEEQLLQPATTATIAHAQYASAESSQFGLLHRKTQL